MLSIKRDRYRKKIRDLEKRIASLDAEIRSMESFISNGARKKNALTRRHFKKEMPDSERRLASYLSTGSFQTIDLRRHEVRAVKIRRAVLIAVLLTAIFLIWIWFRG